MQNTKKPHATSKGTRRQRRAILQIKIMHKFLIVFLFSSVGFAQTHDYALISGAPASYPYLARAKGLEAKVIIELDIGIDGRAKNAKVIESEHGDIFHNSALRAIEDYRFRPRTLNGKPLVVEGVQYSLTFCLENPSPEGASEVCYEE